MGAEPSAQALAAVINQIKTEKIRAVFFENIADHRLLQPDFPGKRRQDRRDPLFGRPIGSERAGFDLP
jgi:hypothetical protein